jgi:hypothetical protein
MRTMQEIRDTGAAWITEGELAMLCAEIERLRVQLREANENVPLLQERTLKAEARIRTLEAAHAECALREADLLKALAERKIPFPPGCSLPDDLRWQQDVRAEVQRLREELALESELVTLHAGGAARAEKEVIDLRADLEVAESRKSGVIRDLKERVREVEEALRELREWHKNEYQSNPDIDARVDAALREEGSAYSGETRAANYYDAFTPPALREEGE